MKTRWDAGQFKLKGKKHLHLSCRCCTVSNYKNECLERETKEEILLAMIEYKLSKQTTLDPDMAKVLYDNLPDLYEK